MRHITMTALPIDAKAIIVINSWLDHRHFGGTLKDGWIPKVGFWVPDVVSCFLYQTDTKVAYIDGFCCNPKASKEQRLAGMISVGKALCDKATELGFEMLLGTTTHQSIADTATACGFHVSEFNYTYMSKHMKGTN